MFHTSKPDEVYNHVKKNILVFAKTGNTFSTMFTIFGPMYP
ncbi:MAG: hypothetical protein QW506_06300 [Thermoproteota archaeon]